MSKNFEIVRKKIFKNYFLKIFIRGGFDLTALARHLETLYSVKRANVTHQRSGKSDLTVYPEIVYDISEVEQEIQLTLNNYFEGNPVDPSFLTETISSLSDKAYYQILDYIIILGKNLEAFKELNTKFDEERYRDYFVPFLNAISVRHSAKGEIFNKKGKTDILVFDNEGNNILIAECKLWRGEAYLLNAVNQLFSNYVNWRDEKTAIIIFNPTVKNFSDVINTSTTTISNHPYCLKSLGQRQGTSYSFLFSHPDDSQQIIKLELVLLNFA